MFKFAFHVVNTFAGVMTLSLCRWASGEKGGAAAEERLLRRLPFFRPEKMDASTDDSPVIAHSSRVDLATPNHYLNTLSIKSTSSGHHPPPATVVLHGYGAGLGFFFQNFPTLAKWAGRRGAHVYALDWLGMGRSARVPFIVKAKRDDVKVRVTEAESFFVDSLEEWREKMGLETMTLVGHSLGAYFSIAYALKFPTRVSKLILLSPAGIPHDPNTTSDPSRELTDAGESSPRESTAELATQKKVEEIKETQVKEKRQESRTRKLLMYLWEEGWSPFQVVRSSLFWGPMLVGKVSPCS
jgi:cardiolipin-specific phospholipase